MLTIVTPVLNGGKYIRTNIESINSLKLPFEHIVVDGGSTDETLEIVSEYQHLKLLHQKNNLGMYDAIAQGFDIAKGDYLGYVNSDDLIVAEGFEFLYELIKRGRHDLVYSDALFNYVHENRKKKMKATRFGKYFLKQGVIPFVQPSSIYTKSIYVEVGGFRPEIFKIAGDLDLFQRMAMKETFRTKCVRKVSTEFIKRGDSLGDVSLERCDLERSYLYRSRDTHMYMRIMNRLAKVI